MTATASTVSTREDITMSKLYADSAVLSLFYSDTSSIYPVAGRFFYVLGTLDTRLVVK